MPLAAIGLALISAVIHAGWNLTVRLRGVSESFVRVPLIITVVGLLPALQMELSGTPFPLRIWVLVALTGAFQAAYYVGLARGYRVGDFTLVYPLVRALPVLGLALIDLARGKDPSRAAWLGIGLVAVGCLVVPNTSLRDIHLSKYANSTTPWVLLSAVSVVGYSLVDKLAVEQIEPGLAGTFRYSIWEFASSALFLWLFLRLLRQPTGLEAWRGGWLWPAVVGAGLFVSYWLILLAFQITAQTSYVVAIRQFSIVIGVAAAALLLHEPAPGLRIGAALMISGGVVLIALGG